jgi:hypothetical protein
MSRAFHTPLSISVIFANAITRLYLLDNRPKWAIDGAVMQWIILFMHECMIGSNVFADDRTVMQRSNGWTFQQIESTTCDRLVMADHHDRPESRGDPYISASEKWWLSQYKCFIIRSWPTQNTKATPTNENKWMFLRAIRTDQWAGPFILHFPLVSFLPTQLLDCPCLTTSRSGPLMGLECDEHYCSGASAC